MKTFASSISEHLNKIAVPVLAVCLSLIFGAIVIVATGGNPIDAYRALLQGSGILPRATYPAFRSILTDFMTTLNALTPMLLAALGVATAFKSGLLNIGVSGQMLLGGFMATSLVGYSTLSPFLARPLVLLIGGVFGGVLGGLIGLLKHKFNVNEVVSSIMTNYIVMHVVSFFIFTNHLDFVSRQSIIINPNASLTLRNRLFEGIGLRMDVPLGLIVALLLTGGIWFLFAKTRIGFEMRAVGLNKEAARYAGINIGRRVVLAMVISGSLAGLAGSAYFLGHNVSIAMRVLPAMGFDSIAVSLLGANNPIAIVFSALLITIINQGSTFMQATARVSHEIASVITGMILLFSACSAYISGHLDSIVGRLKWKQS